MATALSVLIALLSGLGPTSARAAPPGWEKIFQLLGGRDVWISSVRASSHDEWFVGGSWGVARASQNGGLEKREMPGRKIIGMFVDRPGSVFALGDDALVLHFEGGAWTEEHYVPGDPKRPSRGADLVYVGFFPSAAPDAPIVAAGPTSVLVRQPDHTWRSPPKAVAEQLDKLGLLGPEFEKPANCAPGGWRWLGKNRGAFFCQDGRSFIYDAGALTPKGMLPKPCMSTLGGVASRHNQLYATCGASKLWTTEGRGWRLAADFASEPELTDVSVNGACVFVAARHSVWRRCDTSDERER